MRILVLNPFAGEMKEVERCRQVARPETEIVFENIADVYPLNYVTYIYYRHRCADAVANRVVDHAVDGKITAPNIFFETTVAHIARMAAVEIRPVMAKTRHFERLPVDEHQHDAELRAHRNRLREDVSHVLRARARRDIVIFRLFAEQYVAHAATRQISFKPLFSQALDDENGARARRRR